MKTNQRYTKHKKTKQNIKKILSKIQKKLTYQNQSKLQTEQNQ